MSLILNFSNIPPEDDELNNLRNRLEDLQSIVHQLQNVLESVLSALHTKNQRCTDLSSLIEHQNKIIDELRLRVHKMMILHERYFS